MIFAGYKKHHFNLSLKVLAIGFFVLCSAISLADTIEGKVVGVSDGDTITVLDGNKEQHKIRLMGIDAPEKHQAFGNASKQHLSSLVYGKEVTVEWFKHDRYKRIIGKVLLDGQDANLEQIKAGLAWHYKRYQGEQTAQDRVTYAQAEEEARKSRLGLWVDAEPTPPWEWRKSMKGN